MHELEKPAPPGTTALHLSIRQLADLLPKRGMICLITDLLAPVDQLERQLRLLSAMGHDIVLFHLMDRAEIDFTFEKAAHFRDIETGTEHFVDPALARDTYLKNLHTHRAAIRRTCERLGIEHHWTPTDTPLERVLFDFLSARTRQAAKPRRA